METSQISKGMIRAVLGLRDLSLDVPAASSSLAALVDLIFQVAPSPFAEELLCACVHPHPPTHILKSRCLHALAEQVDHSRVQGQDLADETGLGNGIMVQCCLSARSYGAATTRHDRSKCVGASR